MLAREKPSNELPWKVRTEVFTGRVGDPAGAGRPIVAARAYLKDGVVGRVVPNAPASVGTSQRDDPTCLTHASTGRALLRLLCSRSPDSTRRWGNWSRRRDSAQAFLPGASQKWAESKKG